MKSIDMMTTIINNVISNGTLDYSIINELHDLMIWDIYENDTEVLEKYIEMIHAISSKNIPVIGNYRLYAVNNLIYDFITSHTVFGNKLNTSTLTFLNNELYQIIELANKIREELLAFINNNTDELINEYITNMVIPNTFKLDPATNIYSYVIIYDTDYIHTTKIVTHDMDTMNEACLKLHQITGIEKFKQISCSILDTLLYNKVPKVVI